jgi:hypothetical protein
MMPRVLDRPPGRDAMLVPPPGQLSIVREVERVDPEVTGQYQYRTMRPIARMASPVGRM